MLVQIFYKYNMHDRHFFFNPSAFILMFKMSGKVCGNTKEFQGLGQNDRDKCVIISTNIFTNANYKDGSYFFYNPSAFILMF